MKEITIKISCGKFVKEVRVLDNLEDLLEWLEERYDKELF